MRLDALAARTQLVGVEDDLARAFQRVAAVHGELDTAADAVHQRQRQLVFERTDAARQRRLADVRGLCGLAERGLVGQGDQVAQLDQGHRRASLSNADAAC